LHKYQHFIYFLKNAFIIVRIKRNLSVFLSSYKENVHFLQSYIYIYR